MERLSYATLEKAGYDGYLLKSAPEPVLQFGEGNFLRAFVDYFIDRLNEEAGFNGKVCLLQPIPGADALRDAINAQNGLYTLYLRGFEGGKKVNAKRVSVAATSAAAGVIAPVDVSSSSTCHRPSRRTCAARAPPLRRVSQRKRMRRVPSWRIWQRSPSKGSPLRASRTETGASSASRSARRRKGRRTRAKAAGRVDGAASQRRGGSPRKSSRPPAAWKRSSQESVVARRVSTGGTTMVR